MDNPTIDHEFDITRYLSDALGYGDGYVGEEQRRLLERKYVITRKPLADVAHPENKLEYSAAVRKYRPGLTEDEALNWLLDNTAYPFETLQTIRQGMHRDWFAALDKSHYEQMLATMLPGLDADMRGRVLGICRFEPDTQDVESVLKAAAERIIEQDATLAARMLRVEARRAETQQEWEEDTEAREARRAARTLSRARERVANAEQELDRAWAKVADLESLVPGKLD